MSDETALVEVSAKRPTVISRIDELEKGDRLVPGNNLGPFNTISDITVKANDAADNGKHYVTFYSVGGLFLPSNTLVSVIDKEARISR